MPPAVRAYTLFIYLLLAAVSIALGVGSILARRWARALTLIFACFALAAGLLSMLYMLQLLPGLTARLSTGLRVDSAATIVVLVLVWAFMFVLYLGIPGAFVLFYRSRHVKATCERMDPREGWTDRLPLPALAVAIGLGSFSLLSLSALLYGNIFPLFGFVLRGVPSALLVVLLAAGWMLLARGVYRGGRRSLALATVLTAVLALSAIVTSARIDMLDLAGGVGFDSRQLAELRATDMFDRSFGRWRSGGRVGPVVHAHDHAHLARVDLVIDPVGTLEFQHHAVLRPGLRQLRDRIEMLLSAQRQLDENAGIVPAAIADVSRLVLQGGLELVEAVDQLQLREPPIRKDVELRLPAETDEPALPVPGLPVPEPGLAVSLAEAAGDRLRPFPDSRRHLFNRLRIFLPGARGVVRRAPGSRGDAGDQGASEKRAPAAV
jgi:hypothetical protein